MAKKTKKAAEPKTGRRNDEKLTVTATHNPHAEGTKAHDWFELARRSASVGAYLEQGGDRGYIRYWGSKGYLKTS